MIEIIKILKLKKLGGFRLHLQFSDGTEGEWDFSRVVAEGGAMVEPLKSPGISRACFCSSGRLRGPTAVISIPLRCTMK